MADHVHSTRPAPSLMLMSGGVRLAVALALVAVVWGALALALA
jgi:hypothetical protein